MPIQGVQLADHIINGIFLFGLMLGLLTISYLTGAEELDDFSDWKGPKRFDPPKEERSDSFSDL